MKVIELGGRKIKILGAPMTPYYYKKAFNQSFSGDLAALTEMENDLSKLDDINLLQMIWAMERTANKEIAHFEKWLEEFEYLNLDDVIEDVTDEAIDATFRSKEKAVK